MMKNVVQTLVIHLCDVWSVYNILHIVYLDSR